MLVNTSDSKFYFYAYATEYGEETDSLVAFYSCDASAFYDSFYANAEGNGREDDATDGYKRFVANAEKGNAYRMRVEFMVNGLGTMFMSEEPIRPNYHIASAAMEWSAVQAASRFRVSERVSWQGWYKDSSGIHYR